MHEVIERLRKMPGLRIEDGASSWTVRFFKPPIYDFELVVPHDVLEWFVTARDHATGAEVWSDWMDYTDYVPKASENRGQLLADMSKDIEWFVATLTQATGFRLGTERAMLVLCRRVAQWQVEGEWRPLSLTPRAAA